MQAAIFIFYLLLVCSAIIAIPFFKSSGLKRWQLISLFLIKVLSGIAYALFYKLPKYYAGSDTWRFYRLSLQEKEWLLDDPLRFTKDLFVHGYDKAGGLFVGENSYWNDLKSNVIIKMTAVMNVATNSSYYTNIILFNLLFIFGSVALFKLFNDVFPGKKWLIIFGIFLLPSTLFWCSGIHKDGLILSAVGLITYYFYAGLKERKFSVKHILVIALCLILIFSLRNYVAIALLPALFCWWWSTKLTGRRWLPFLIVYLFGVILFFSSKYIIPALDFPQYVAQKQFEFSQLEGASTVINKTLKPTVSSFISFLPSAIDMAFFRPHILEAKNLSYIPAALENILLIVILLVAFFRRDKKQKIPVAFWFCIFFSGGILLLSGYTITLSGAIVRYRSISLPLIITPMLCLIDFSAIRDKINSKSNRKVNGDINTLLRNR